MVEEFCQNSDHDSLAVPIFRVRLALDHIQHIFERLTHIMRSENRLLEPKSNRYHANYQVRQVPTTSVQFLRLEQDLYTSVDAAQNVRKTMKFLNYDVKSAAYHSKQIERLQKVMNQNWRQENDYLESEMVVFSNFTRLILQDKRIVDEMENKVKELEIEFKKLFELLEPRIWQMANEDKECDVDDIIQNSRMQYNTLVAKSKTVMILTERIQSLFGAAMRLKVVKLMEPQIKKSEGYDFLNALPVMLEKQQRCRILTSPLPRYTYRSTI